MTTDYLEIALNAARVERYRQIHQWGDQSNNHLFEWMSILGEEYGELCEAVNETHFHNAKHPKRGGIENVLREATQVAAVSLAIVEAMMKQQDLRRKMEVYSDARKNDRSPAG